MDSDSEGTEPTDVMAMSKHMSEIALVAASWKIDSSKYTQGLMDGVDKLTTDCAVMMSIVEATHGNPEETLPSDFTSKYASLVEEFMELNEIAKSMQEDKKRLLTPEKSMN